jgi:hypothetical protein
MSVHRRISAMKRCHPVPSDKRPLSHNYSNWEFWRVRRLHGILEVAYDPRRAWRAATVVAGLCFGFAVLLWALVPDSTKGRWPVVAIATLTAAGILSGTCWRIYREQRKPSILHLDTLAGRIEFPRHGVSADIKDVRIVLQVYRAPSDDDVCSELNALVGTAGARYPVAKILGQDDELDVLGKTLAEFGVSYDKEDLTEFARSEATERD